MGIGLFTSEKIACCDFLGPLDLFLDLLHRNEIDPKEVELSPLFAAHLQEKIAEESFHVSSLSTALWAALILVKSRALLPQGEEEEEAVSSFEEDPLHLARHLLEYSEIEPLKALLETMMTLASRSFPRPLPVPQKRAKPFPSSLSLGSLEEAFSQVEKRNLQKYGLIVKESFEPDRWRGYLLERMQSGPFPLSELFQLTKEKREQIGLFLIFLELVKKGKSHIDAGSYISLR